MKVYYYLTKHTTFSIMLIMVKDAIKFLVKVAAVVYLVILAHILMGYTWPDTLAILFVVVVTVQLIYEYGYGKGQKDAAERKDRYYEELLG